MERKRANDEEKAARREEEKGVMVSP